HQEQAAADQDDVPPGNPHSENGEERSAQRHQRRQGEEQGEAENERQRQADPARPVRRPLIATRDQNRDENQVVDAEDDLERGERDKRRPSVRISQKLKHAAYPRRSAASPLRQGSRGRSQPALPQSRAAGSDSEPVP